MIPFPANPTVMRVQGKPLFAFPFRHGGGRYTLFGFNRVGDICSILPNGEIEPLFPFTVLEMPCGELVNISSIVECIRHKVALN